MLSGIESREELLVIISNLTSKNEEQKEIIHRLETEREQLEQRLQWLESQLHLLRQKRYGVSSERMAEGQGKLFKEEEEILSQEASEGVEAIIYEGKKRGRKRLAADIPRERIEYELPEEEQNCPECRTYAQDRGRGTKRTEYSACACKSSRTCAHQIRV